MEKSCVAKTGAAAPQRLTIEFRMPRRSEHSITPRKRRQVERPPGTAGANAALSGKVRSPGEWPCSRAHPFYLPTKGQWAASGD
jgi:hypothetical protein